MHYRTLNNQMAQSHCQKTYYVSASELLTYSILVSKKRCLDGLTTDRGYR
jgi:hypothetical protein